MGFLDFFSGKPRRFVSERGFEENLALQLEMTPMTVQQIHKLGVSPEQKLKLEFVFYTNTPEKAEALAARLQAFGYEVDFGVAEVDQKQMVVTGWTRPMLMSHPVVLAWTRKMCEVGFANDCGFDGWGAGSPR